MTVFIASAAPSLLDLPCISCGGKLLTNAEHQTFAGMDDRTIDGEELGMFRCALHFRRSSIVISGTMLISGR